MSRQVAKPPRVLEEPSKAADALAATLVDSALEVHRSLGPAFAESVYENALCHELLLRCVPFQRQVAVAIRYKDAVVGEGRADLVLGTLVVVELKAVPALAPVHSAQLLSYLKATGVSLGLLVNFGDRYMKTGIRRLILTP